MATWGTWSSEPALLLLPLPLLLAPSCLPSPLFSEDCARRGVRQQRSTRMSGNEVGSEKAETEVDTINPQMTMWKVGPVARSSTSSFCAVRRSSRALTCPRPGKSDRPIRSAAEEAAAQWEGGAVWARSHAQPSQTAKHDRATVCEAAGWSARKTPAGCISAGPGPPQTGRTPLRSRGSKRRYHSRKRGQSEELTVIGRRVRVKAVGRRHACTKIRTSRERISTR